MKAAGIKNTIGAISLLLVLVIASWLPTRFIRSPPPPSAVPMSRSEKIALFDVCSKAIAAEKEPPVGYRIDSQDSSELMLEELETKLKVILDEYLLIDIEKNNITVVNEASGQDCYIFSNVAGQSIRVWRYYSEWFGDWKNWLDFYIDIETGEIYYLYLSAGCEKNRALYKNRDRVTNTEELAQALGEICGYRLTGFKWNLDPEAYATAEYVYGEERISYSIRCKYHQAALADYRIIMQG